VTDERAVLWALIGILAVVTMTLAVAAVRVALS
jgi:hypothetical protein